MTESTIYMDGWDYLPIQDFRSAWNAFMDADGWYGNIERMATAPGRFGIGSCLHFTTAAGGGFGGTCFKVMPTRIENCEVCIELAWKLPAGQLTTTWGPAIGLFDSITGFYLLHIVPYSLGSIVVSMPAFQGGGANAIIGGDAPIVGRSRPGIIKGDTWHFVQAKIGMGVGGHVQIKIDGEIVIDLTSIDVKPGGAPVSGYGYGFDTFTLGIGQDTGIFEYWVDDLIIHKTTGFSAPYNDYLGNIRVGAILPNAVGDNTDFTAVGAAQNWQAVTADYDMAITDPTYVQTDVVGNYDLYNFQTSVPSRALFGIQLTNFYRQTDAIQLFSKNVMKTGGVIYEGEERGVAQTYVSRWTNWDLNPNTSVAWTDTDLAAIQAGPKLNRSE